MRTREPYNRADYDYSDIYELAESIEKYCNEFLGGSGLNYSFESTVYEKQNTIHVDTFYQCMNEHGYYVGSIPVKLVFDVKNNEAILRSVKYRKDFKGCYIGDYLSYFFYQESQIYK